jgi:invasion protein IalB
MVRRCIALLAAALLLPALPAARAESPAAWQVSCYGEGATRSCEAAQAVLIAGTPTPLAQAALGWLGPDAPLMLTIVVAPDVSLSSPLVLAMDGQDKLTLPWTRCRPSGCFAGADLTDEQVDILRKGEPKGSAQMSFTDGGEAAILLRLPLAGIKDALDRLERSRRG